MSRHFERLAYVNLVCAAGALMVFCQIESASADQALSPETQLQETSALLQDVEKQFQPDRSLEGALVDFSRIGSLLDMFELQFGSAPQEVSGWQEVRARAEALLPIFEKLSKEDRLIYIDADSSEVSEVVLLELVGKPEKAVEKLKSVTPGGGCGNWHATVMLAVEQRKAGILQRMGRYKEALAAMRAAEQEARLSLYFPDADQFYARYAFLLSKGGEQAKADETYQRVVDLWPGTRGEILSRKMLQTRNVTNKDLADTWLAWLAENRPALQQSWRF